MTTVFTNSQGQQVLSITQGGGTLTLTATSYNGAFIRSVELAGEFSHIDGLVKSGEFTTPTISLDGKTLTLDLEFATANNGAKRFNENDSLTFDFSGTGMESAVAHVQGFAWGSEKITGCTTIPEPGSVLIGSIGLFLLLRRRLRR